MMYCLLEPFKDWPVESIMKAKVAGYKKPYKEKPYRRKAQQFLISM